jgi:negative regulator of flagellin synthesis FlgM
VVLENAMKIITPPDTPSPAKSGAVANASSQPEKQAALAQTAVATANTSAKAPGVLYSASSLAQAMENTEASNAADVDTAKVAAVKAALENGSFQVNPEAIADKLLSNAQEMLNRSVAG